MDERILWGLAFVLYVVVGRLLVASRLRLRAWAFAGLNLLAVYLVDYYHQAYEARNFHGFVEYLELVLIQYVALRLFGQSRGWWSWIAFWVPIIFLCVHLLTPIEVWAGTHALAPLFPRAMVAAWRDYLVKHPTFKIGEKFMGLSFLCFRTSQLALEVRNRVVPRPTLGEYLGFVLFAPTLAVGPISPYAIHRQAFAESERPPIPWLEAGLRILVGAVKLEIFGPILSKMDYAGLMFDGARHAPVDLGLAGVAYYLFLFCNFSGYCDIAIGTAGLMGIPVAENFHAPLTARNLRDFWNRWHITLSSYMRDVVFSPLSKALVRLFGPAAANHAIAVTITVVFLLIGLWHGVAWHYLAYGAVQAAGVVTVHYYTIFLKKRLGKERFAAYNKSRVIRWAAVVTTFAFTVFSLLFFANEFDQIRQMLAIVRSH